MSKLLIPSVLALTLTTSCIVLPIPAAVENVTLTPDAGTAIVPAQPTAVLALGDHPLPPDLLACVQSSMAEAAPELPMLESAAFRDALFPWFEPPVIATQGKALAAILARTTVRQRIDALSARYLVLVGDLKSFTGETEGPWGPQIMLPAGVGWAEETVQLAASVWDLHDGAPVGTLAVTASGEAVTATWVGATVVLLPMTESKACGELGRQLALLLTGRRISHPQGLS
jgi:hypothetical protein